MDIHLLVTGRLADDVARELTRRGFPHPLRAVAEPTESDLDRATALCGFAMPAEAAGGRRWPWVHCMGAGHDAFAPYRDDIDLLTRTIGTMPAQMARYVVAAATSFLTGLDDYREDRTQRVWSPRPYRAPGRAVVLGTGEIGAEVGRMLGLIGFDTIGVNTDGHAAQGFSRTIGWDRLEPLMPGCQVLVNLLPATPQTVGRVGTDVLGRMRGGLYVSAGRGITTDHDALREALEAGQVTRAVLDVTHPEPPEEGSWLWSHPGVSLTPHVAARSLPEDIAAALLDVATDLASGRRPRWTVTAGRPLSG